MSRSIINCRSSDFESARTDTGWDHQRLEKWRIWMRIVALPDFMERKSLDSPAFYFGVSGNNLMWRLETPPTRNALDSIPSLRRGNCRKGRAKKYRQESRMGRFQKNANETKAT